MTDCFFVTDIHGSIDRYHKLFQHIAEQPPKVVLMGGDLLPHGLASSSPAVAHLKDFAREFLAAEFSHLKEMLGDAYPRVFLIFGNDDPRSQEKVFIEAGKRGLWEYIHNRKVEYNGYDIYGYAHVPPTPFMLKDWDRYDVSRYIDPGCISPEEGHRSIPVSASESRNSTIKKDLKRLAGKGELRRAIFLFHTPPYQTKLDRAALDGKMVDHAPLDVHVGSIAVREFIEKRQPYLTLHGHVHESTRLTGEWRQQIGKTRMMSAAHDGPELALVRFDLEDLSAATRELI